MIAAAGLFAGVQNALAGGVCGGWLVHRLPEKIMRGFVVLVGATLTVWMFVR